ncbi:OmpA family protein [Arenibacterium sp. CAU 1754]
MRLSKVFIVLMTFLAAAGLCVIAAGFLATKVEEGAEISVRQALDAQNHDWAEVHANGLQVILTGTARDEATRFHALSTVGEVVDTARIINSIDVEQSRALAPPRFSVEILRNDSGVSIIGLIPAGSDREALIEDLAGVATPTPVTDLLETADHPVPRGWNDAMGFTVTALEKLPRSKVSVDAGRISITAIANSVEAKQTLEKELRKAAPPGLHLTLDIAAPRPVVTPFTMRYLIDETGGRFDACSADTEIARDRILKAAAAAGGTGGAKCVLALGVPSPKWADAVTLALGALSELGLGSVTIADADITLVAAEGTNPAVFDRVVGELETALPEVFVVHAVLPVPAGKGDSGPTEFVATLSPEGLVQLRGRVSDENLRYMADSYAKSRFGSASVYTAARIASNLPADWSLRVLTALEALSELNNGAVVVTPDNLSVRGTTSREDARAKIAGLLAGKLGEAEKYDLDINYVEPPVPADEKPAPTPEACEAELAEIQRSSGKITFEPGSATIAAESLETMNAIAELLAECGEFKLEIQGHTDSQGRTEMNQQLSQQRAQSVLNELRARRILTSSYTAVGYGETLPIATNKTEEGREENRRIEFRLIRPKPIKETQTTLESVAEEAPVAQSDTPEGYNAGAEGNGNE